jgi:hypothetical protein
VPLPLPELPELPVLAPLVEPLLLAPASSPVDPLDDPPTPVPLSSPPLELEERAPPSPEDDPPDEVPPRDAPEDPQRSVNSPKLARAAARRSDGLGMKFSIGGDSPA